MQIVHMASKPQKEQRDGNHTLRQTLNNSDTLNYFSKGSGYFCGGAKGRLEQDVNYHMIFHYIYIQRLMEVTYYCQKILIILYPLLKTAVMGFRENKFTFVSCQQNLFFSISCQHWDQNSIEELNTGLFWNQNGSEMQCMDGRELLCKIIQDALVIILLVQTSVSLLTSTRNTTTGSVNFSFIHPFAFLIPSQILLT